MNIGFSRQKSTLLTGSLIFLLGIPATLSFSSLADVKGIAGRPIFESMDFIASNVLLPLGGLTVILFCGWKWGIRQMLQESAAKTKRGSRVKPFGLLSFVGSPRS